MSSTANSTVAALTTTQFDCGIPPAISAATSVVVRDVVTYTCNSGYVLHGHPDNVTCSINGQWEGDPPTCVIQKKSIDIKNLPKIFNQIQAIPLWLLIIMGAVGGCAALLMLCCMLLLCLKCFGCFDSNKKWEPEDDTTDSVCCVRKRAIRHDSPVFDNSPRQEDMVKPVNETPSTKVLTLTEHSAVTRKEVTTSLPPTYAGLYKHRKKAKSIKKWMPHSHKVRPFNTSTK